MLINKRERLLESIIYPNTRKLIISIIPSLSITTYQSGNDRKTEVEQNIHGKLIYSTIITHLTDIINPITSTKFNNSLTLKLNDIIKKSSKSDFRSKIHQMSKQ